jgi:hypothetical protein
MIEPQKLCCDGCGQIASPEHLAQRFARLELTTRYRPVHIQALLLGAVAPKNPSSFLYSLEGPFEGEAGLLLEALEISTDGKSREAVLAEFQKRGLLLSHVLECAFEGNSSAGSLGGLLDKQLAPTLVRIRRSLKPKKVIVISNELMGLVNRMGTEAGCPVIGIDLGKLGDGRGRIEATRVFRQALAVTGAVIA